MTTQGPAATCRSCHGRDLIPIVDLGPQPDPDQLLDSWSTETAPSAPIQASLCPACGLVQLVGPRPNGRPLHGHRLASTPDDIRRDPWFGMLVRSVPDAHRTVLQVEHPDPGISAAFATAGVAETTGGEAATDSDQPVVGIVSAGHAFCHVEDPDALLTSLERRLAPDGLLDFECHHVQGLAEGQFDVLSHAHRSYFSLHSLERLLDRHGLVVSAAEWISRFGGSLRIVATRRSQSVINPGADPLSIDRIRSAEQGARLAEVAGYASVPAAVRRVSADLRAFLDEEHAAGRSVAGYGAAARGTTLLNIAQVGVDRLAFIVDRSPDKQDRLLPGSRIPVLAPDAIDARRPDDILVLPWPLADEIVAQSATARARGARFVVAMPSLRVVA